MKSSLLTTRRPVGSASPLPWYLGGLGLLFGIYVFFFTDWISPTPIEITAVSREINFQNRGMARLGRPAREMRPNGETQPKNDAKPGRAVDKQNAEHRTERREPKLDDFSMKQFEEVMPVFFSMDQPYRITRVKVTEAESTANVPKIVWQQKSGWIGSWPSRLVLYGRNVPWMKPMVDNADPLPLKPGVKYRVEIEAGRRKGETTFTARAKTRASSI